MTGDRRVADQTTTIDMMMPVVEEEGKMTCIGETVCMIDTVEETMTAEVDLTMAEATTAGTTTTMMIGMMTDGADIMTMVCSISVDVSSLEVAHMFFFTCRLWKQWLQERLICMGRCEGHD